MDLWFVEAYDRDMHMRITYSDLKTSREEAEKTAAVYRRDYDADVEICWIWLDK